MADIRTRNAMRMVADYLCARQCIAAHETDIGAMLSPDATKAAQRMRANHALHALREAGLARRVGPKPDGMWTLTENGVGVYSPIRPDMYADEEHAQ